MRTHGRLVLAACILVVCVSASHVVPSVTTAYVKGRLQLWLAADPPPAPADKPDQPVSLSSCAVRPPGELTFTVLPERPGPDNDAVLKLLGDYGKGLCGVQVQPVSKAHAGTWSLRAEFKAANASAASADAVVTVSEYSDGVLPEKPSVTEGGSGFTLRLVTIGKDLKFTTCGVIPPWSSGAVVPLEPGAAAAAGPDADRLRYFPGNGAAGSLDKGWCAVEVVGVRGKDGGRWILEATVKDTGVVRRGYTAVTVYTPRMAISPSSEMNAEQKETAVMRLVFAETRASGDVQWTGCQAVTPDGAVVQLSGQGPRTASSTDETVRPSGPAGVECGARIGPLEARHAGKWTLVGEAGGEERSASARLAVQEAYRPSASNEVSVMLGARNQPLDCGPEKALFCELRDPAGAVATSSAGPCRHTLERVRTVHNGSWTCSMLLPGYSDAVNDTVVLVLADPVRVVTGVVVPAARTGRTVDAEPPLVLQCRLAGTRACPNALVYCRMDSPSGERHLLKDGVVGSGRYSYAGEGFHRCDCSMAISRPLAPGDIGVWRCVMGFQSSRRAGYVELPGADRSARDTSAAGAGLVAFRSPVDGVVTPGAAATVGCRAPGALAYCWLRTPRGERLSVVDASSADGQPRYAGMGFEFGECGVSIPEASVANHSGTWRCGVGLVGRGGPSIDLEVPVELTVSASLVVPLEVRVVGATGHAATLGCRTLLGDALDYCRFQRPDGLSVHLADAGLTPDGDGSLRYRYLGADGEGGGLAEGYCRLAIAALAEEDYGDWVCAVRVAGEVRGREQTASVVLEPSGGVADAGVVGGAVAAAVLLLAAASFVGYRRFRPRLSRRSPSISSSQTSDAPMAPNLAAASLTTPRGLSQPAVRRTTTRSSARVAATMMPSTRLPARMRGASGARALDEAIGLEPLPRTLPAAPEDSSSSDVDVDVFPAASRKTQ
ncbi:uncharacterized protein LOC113211354 isoform X2 [Frankliniella occidentalis]|uniref:Uncharacterized protein LOC113211354 isoform X2 n=1 Tax=Frankliniella occidentalis TaxID=133901 RepID=A0A9C6X320_FRAOC|nr:uncharacterized protein LOC113211354 isoform X2 [Frankliniella occidentalis]